MAQPAKKPWTKPCLQHFETPEMLFAYCSRKATDDERKKLAELLEQMQSFRRARASMPQLRRSAKR